MPSDQRSRDAFEQHFSAKRDSLPGHSAMHLLQSGVDLTVIALWLGHEDPSTTHLYVEADLEMKEAALRHLEDPGPAPLRFLARDRLLSFLEAL